MTFPDCNPILLFELRQLVRNRFIVWLTLLYLAVMVLLMGAVLLDSGALLGFSPETQGREAAKGLLVIYYGFTTAATLGFGMVKTAVDRLRESPVYNTSLSPLRLAWGKFLFGLVVALLFLCMTLPFFSVVYLLRGVDPFGFLYGLFAVFYAIIVQYLYLIVFLSGAKTVGRLIGLCFPLALLELQSLYHTGMFVPFMLTFDIPFNYFLVQLVFFCEFCLLLILLTAAQLSPETSNRMFPFRLTLTLIQLVFGVVFCGFTVGIPLSSQSLGFLLNRTFWIRLPQFFVIFICERELLSDRQRRTIPTTLRGRLLAFPFYTGAANAMAWCVLALTLEIATVGGVYLVNALVNPMSLSDESTLRSTMSAFSYGLLFFDYCATWLLLYNVLLYRFLSRYWNWVFPFCILLIGEFSRTVLPLTGMSDRFPWFPVYFYYGTFPDGAFITIQYTIAICWAMLLLGIGPPWVRRRFQEFQRSD